MRYTAERASDHARDEFRARGRTLAAARSRTRTTLVAATLCGAGALWLASTREPAERTRDLDGASLVEPHALAAPLAEPAAELAPGRTALRARSTRVATPAVPALESREARTEREYLLELRALAAADATAFDARCESVWSAAGPACEQFAALRALYELRGAGAAERLARAVAELPSEVSAGGDAVPRAFVQWLARRAAFELPARAALDAIVWGEAHAAPELRNLALRERLLLAPPEDLAELTRRIHAERDSSVHSAGLACLDERAGASSSGER